MAKITFTVPDMACSACAETITKAICEMDTAAVVDANPDTKAVAVDSQVSAEQLQKAIATAGYTVA